MKSSFNSNMTFDLMEVDLTKQWRKPTIPVSDLTIAISRSALFGNNDKK